LYYKLVAHYDSEWLKKEFLAGRARFGWSGPGSDLHVIKQTPPDARTPAQHIAWKYTQFLIERLRVGDRIVYQFDRPLRSFLIGEIIAPGYSSDPASLEDFNHTLSVKPLVREPIPVNASCVSGSLRHNLSKRGQYYGMYSDRSTKELHTIVDGLAARSLSLDSVRSLQDEFDEGAREVISNAVKEIRQRWPAKGFEPFCAWLLSTLENVEVSSQSDVGRGWDLQIRLVDPITRDTLFEPVPVQCKNFAGLVRDERPIDDLLRAIRNSGASIAYLMILGNIDDEYKATLEARQVELETELKRPVRLCIVDEEAIATHYLRAIGLGQSFQSLDA
jgi:hypothetical protein